MTVVMTPLPKGEKWIVVGNVVYCDLEYIEECKLKFVINEKALANN